MSSINSKGCSEVQTYEEIDSPEMHLYYSFSAEEKMAKSSFYSVALYMLKDGSVVVVTEACKTQNPTIKNLQYIGIGKFIGNR